MTLLSTFILQSACTAMANLESENPSEIQDIYDGEDPKDDNGQILEGKYLPEELIAMILCYVDHKSMLNAQLVCKRWKMLMKNYVWRKKAECTFGRSLLSIKNVPWDVYYAICNNVFERNLLKNPRECKGVKYWKIAEIEETFPPQKRHRFVTSIHACNMRQKIDLTSEGFTSHILDHFQPLIVVSIWFSCRSRSSELYKCRIKLLGSQGTVIDVFKFQSKIEDEPRGRWHNVNHKFANYGPGLRKIKFHHQLTDCFWFAGYYGSKIAGASIWIQILNEPDSLPEPISSEP